MPTESQSPSLGLALSGGGHRAALWALGALACLADSGRSRYVQHVSSVSGGSITNGYVGLKVRYDTIDGDGFVDQVVRSLAPVLAKESTLLDHPVAKLATLSMAGGALGAVGGAAGLALAAFGVASIAPAALAAIAGVSGATAVGIFRRRGELCRMSFDRQLFHGAGLDKLGDGKVEHVLCATDLQFAEHVYLSGRFVYAWRLGVGEPKPLSLAAAVQASASFPFGFPARVVSTRDFRFQYNARIPDEPPRVPEVLALIDGGVYDNMADQWLVGLSRRLKPDAPQRSEDPGVARQRADLLRTRLVHPAPPAEILVINASPAYPRADFRRSWLGVREEADVAVRVLSAMHDNSTSQRRQSLVNRFREGENDPTGRKMRGALVHVATTPLAAIDDVGPSGTPEQRARTRDALDFVRGASDVDAADLETHWRHIARTSGEVGTTLWALGIPAASQLLHHAYVLTAVQSHVYLGHPLPSIERARRDRFAALADGRLPNA